jgi:hypothetical protein
MGVRAGVVLSALGFASLVVGYVILVSLFLGLPGSSGVAGWLAGLVVVALLAVGGVLWLISSLLYLLAYLATRGSRSRLVGFLMVLGGVLNLPIMLITVQLPSVVDAAYGLVAMLLTPLPLVLGLLLIIAGLRRWGCLGVP